MCRDTNEFGSVNDDLREFLGDAVGEESASGRGDEAGDAIEGERSGVKAAIGRPIAS